MIKTEKLAFYYQQKQHTFSFPDIVLDEQEDLLIVGKSGIGKTTLLHLLAGLLKPVEGSILINETAINTLSASKLDKFRGQNIGLVLQKNHAIQTLSVINNLKARIFFSKKNVDNTVIEHLLKELGLFEYKDRNIKQLSEGQLQRLAIALSVIHNPKVILADEPTSSLDDENCKIVIELLKKQAKNTNANLIVITHDHRIKSFFQKTIEL